MSETASDIPTAREELERKALTELVRLAEQVALGHLEQGVAAECARTVWNVTAGLIPAETCEMAAKVVNDYAPQMRRVNFFKAGDVYTFAWHDAKNDFHFIKRGLSHPTPDHKHVPIDRMDRPARLEKLFAALVASKWTRL